MIKAILFDLDATLLDEEKAAESAVRQLQATIQNQGKRMAASTFGYPAPV